MGWWRQIPYAVADAYGGVSPPPQVFGKHHAFRWEAGRRRPTRRRPPVLWPRRGCWEHHLQRGGSSHGADPAILLGSLTITRYGTVVAGIQGPGPVRREITNMRQGGAKRRPPSREDASARLRKQKPGGASDKAGGQGVRSSYSRDQRSGGGTPPPIHRHGASYQVSAPGRKEDDIEVGDEKSSQGQPEGAARMEPSDRELRDTPRASARGEGGFHLAVSHFR